MRGMEHIWKAWMYNQNHIRAVEVGTCNFIIVNVNATWIQ